MNLHEIADILEEAADKYLRPSSLYYSCHAIRDAVGVRHNIEPFYIHYELVGISGQTREYVNRIKRAKRDFKQIIAGLKAMGVNPHSVMEFTSLSFNTDIQQQARYAWLTFAAMIAREQAKCHDDCN
jgi:hypothetical protein